MNPENAQIKRAIQTFDAQSTEAYLQGPPRQVPGFSSLHKMVSLLIAERAPSNGRILVLGAGGGLELKSLAEAHPGWTFDGVDPSTNMLHIAEQVLASYADRIHLYKGYIDSAPPGPFDAATCLLTFHFIPRAQRMETLRQIRHRLQPGAPLVVAHISFPQSEPERSQWISRHVTYANDGVIDPERIAQANHAMREQLTILEPEEEEIMLRSAGFADVSLFYAGFGFKGWVAYAG